MAASSRRWHLSGTRRPTSRFSWCRICSWRARDLTPSTIAFSTPSPTSPAPRRSRFQWSISRRSRRRRAGGVPDIFVIALDSLRRDYLSPYNAAVSFTPAIGPLAADGFVFDNAFTRHGGTELAIPSIWAGGMLVRQVRVRGFERVNAFEKLVNSEGYRILINDFTIAQNILPSTPVTRLNPGVPSADTDLCGNLEALQSGARRYAATMPRRSSATSRR